MGSARLFGNARHFLVLLGRSESKRLRFNQVLRSCSYVVRKNVARRDGWWGNEKGKERKETKSLGPTLSACQDPQHVPYLGDQRLSNCASHYAIYMQVVGKLLAHAKSNHYGRTATQTLEIMDSFVGNYYTQYM